MNETDTPTPRRGPDLFTLLVGLGALGIAGATLFADTAWQRSVNSRWLLAALALLVGLLLVVGSLRPPRRGTR
jgi:hypothetical protein